MPAVKELGMVFWVNVRIWFNARRQLPTNWKRVGSLECLERGTGVSYLYIQEGVMAWIVRWPWRSYGNWKTSAVAGFSVTESLVHGEVPVRHMCELPLSPHSMAAGDIDSRRPVLGITMLSLYACWGTPQTWLRLNFLPEESIVGEQIYTRCCK